MKEIGLLISKLCQRERLANPLCGDQRGVVGNNLEAPWLG